MWPVGDACVKLKSMLQSVPYIDRIKTINYNYNNVFHGDDTVHTYTVVELRYLCLLSDFFFLVERFDLAEANFLTGSETQIL